MISDFQRGWLKRSAKRCNKVTLYRFFPYAANSLGPLICDGLYFSSPKDFNDPFDCDFKMMPNDFEKKLGVSWSDAVAAARRRVAQMGVVCFTPHWDSTLMWAHYADKFKGFCLGYEFENPLHRNRRLDDLLVTYRNRSYYIVDFYLDEIIYASRDKLPTASSFHFDDVDEQMPEALLRYKASDWQYEHECRLSFEGGKGIHPVPGKLKEVYFGLRMGKEEKRVLQTILEKHNPVFYKTAKSDSHIKVCRKVLKEPLF